jgi:prephenate dehydrogenase
MKLGNSEALEDLIRGASEMRAGWQMGGPKSGGGR